MEARERWNRRYAERGVNAFPEAPSEWLIENRAALSGWGGRRALDLACGDGRNASYLARLGFEVDAVDVSDVVIDALQAAATDRGLAVNPLRLDLERNPLPGSDYDVIVQLNYLQRSLLGSLAQALAAGGILIVETVTRRNAEELGNHFDPRFLLDRDELLTSFPDLDVLRYEEGVAERSGRPRAVASLVARKPRKGAGLREVHSFGLDPLLLAASVADRQTTLSEPRRRCHHRQRDESERREHRLSRAGRLPSPAGLSGADRPLRRGAVRSDWGSSPAKASPGPDPLVVVGAGAGASDRGNLTRGL